MTFIEFLACLLYFHIAVLPSKTIRTQFLKHYLLKNSKNLFKVPIYIHIYDLVSLFNGVYIDIYDMNNVIFFFFFGYVTVNSATIRM